MNLKTTERQKLITIKEESIVMKIKNRKKNDQNLLVQK